jgi:hypothetical protein
MNKSHYEKYKAMYKRWRDAHKAHIKEYNAAYYLENKTFLDKKHLDTYYKNIREKRMNEKD